MAEREYVFIAWPLALIVLVVICLIIYAWYPAPFKAVFEFADEIIGLSGAAEDEALTLSTASATVSSFVDCVKTDGQHCSCAFGLTELPDDYTVILENKGSDVSVTALDPEEKPLSETAKLIKNLHVGIAVIQKTEKKVMGADISVMELGCIFEEKVILRGKGSKPNIVLNLGSSPLIPPFLYLNYF